MNHLGFFTDMYFFEDGVEFKEFPTYYFLLSPKTPYFYFGNFLYLKHHPKSEDKKQLEQFFKRHFTDERIQHFTFCWSGPLSQNIQSFIDDQYIAEENIVLKASKDDLIPLKQKNNAVLLRPFGNDRDWQEWIEFESDDRPEIFPLDDFLKFLNDRRDVYQALNQKGQGNFYGAYLNNRLVASAGLFYKEKIGRFQSVKTRKEYRNQGICKTLIHYISKEGLTHLDTLVMVANKGYHALTIYKNLGFHNADSYTSIYKVPR